MKILYYQGSSPSKCQSRENAKILAEETGDEGVLKEMAEMLAAHFSKEELKKFLNSPNDS